MITDKLASYGAARNEVMPSIERRAARGRAFEVWSDINGVSARA